MLEREAESLKKSVSITRRAYENAWHENYALREQILQLQAELANYRVGARWGR